jgi:hypothetical protein
MGGVTLVGHFVAAPVLALAVAITCGCGSSAPSVRERFDASRVEVDIHLEGSAASRTVVATFRPLEDGLHLYGTALAMEGIDGAGRPTRVDVADAGWRAVGPAQASELTEDVTLAGFDEPFPIYPDGPITLRQAVESTGDLDDGRIDLSITFMACSSAGVCFAPVERHAVSLSSG